MTVKLWLVSRECFSKQTWPEPLVSVEANSSAHSLYLLSKEEIHKAHGQEQGMKLDWVFWLATQAGARAEREYQPGKSGSPLSHVSRDPEGGPAAALLPLASDANGSCGLHSVNLCWLGICSCQQCTHVSLLVEVSKDTGKNEMQQNLAFVLEPKGKECFQLAFRG